MVAHSRMVVVAAATGVAIAMSAFVAGLFFLRFAMRSHDRWVIFFAVSFWIECVGRIQTGLNASWSEDTPGVYLLRLPHPLRHLGQEPAPPPLRAAAKPPAAAPAGPRRAWHTAAR